MFNNFLFFNKKKVFFNLSKNLRPTKVIVREKFFSWIISFVNKSYVIDFFSGSCIFGFYFFYFNAKKIINLDVDKNNIQNIFLNAKSLNISFTDKFLLIEFDSSIWIEKYTILNISIIIFDPPYNFLKNKKFYLYFYNFFFVRKCLLFYIEVNNINSIDSYFFAYFLLKKNSIGRVLFFLFKRV